MQAIATVILGYIRMFRKFILEQVLGTNFLSSGCVSFSNQKVDLVYTWWFEGEISHKNFLIQEVSLQQKIFVGSVFITK